MCSRPPLPRPRPPSADTRARLAPKRQRRGAGRGLWDRNPASSYRMTRRPSRSPWAGPSRSRTAGEKGLDSGHSRAVGGMMAIEDPTKLPSSISQLLVNVPRASRSSSARFTRARCCQVSVLEFDLSLLPPPEVCFVWLLRLPIQKRRFRAWLRGSLAGLRSHNRNEHMIHCTLSLVADDLHTDRHTSY